MLLFSKEGVCSSYSGIALRLPGKAYARELQKIICPIVELRIQEENYGFRPDREKLD